MKIVFALVFLLALVGCTTVEQDTRLSTSLTAMEYNDVGARYMPQPTFVSTQKMSDGKSVLMVHMNTYGVPHVYDNSGLSPSVLDTMKYFELRFSKENVTGYVSAIDKYLEWESLASERKDQLTKEIGQVPTWGNGGSNVLLKFTFHSGNEHEHFLVVSVHSMGIDLEDSQVYDQQNAKELKRLLLAFASGSLQHTDINSVYK